jgi:CubicO group peptidase (beta-lactamase class C family)
MQKQLSKIFLVALLSVFSIFLSGPNLGHLPYAIAQSSFLPTSSATEQGIYQSVLDDLVARAATNEFGILDSLIIIRNDHIVLEEYFRTHTRFRNHQLYSVSKSITSAIIGAAVTNGMITNLNDPILNYFPNYNQGNLANWDNRKASITLENLLTMQAGIEWDEWSAPYGTPGNSTWSLFGSPNWIKYMLDRPMSSSPGSEFTYNSGATVLLAGILNEATGQNALEFANENLFGPLGITNVLWESGASGAYNAGWGLWMKSIDMAKIGYLFLNGGSWNGVQILSSGWIDQSVRARVPNATGNLSYGYQWWIETRDGLEIWSARGFGGQFIFIIPEQEMVIVMNAQNFSGSGGAAQRTTMLDSIIGAIN